MHSEEMVSMRHVSCIFRPENPEIGSDSALLSTMCCLLRVYGISEGTKYDTGTIGIVCPSSCRIARLSVADGDEAKIERTLYRIPRLCYSQVVVRPLMAAPSSSAEPEENT